MYKKIFTTKNKINQIHTDQDNSQDTDQEIAKINSDKQMRPLVTLTTGKSIKSKQPVL